jgi:23S rRNA (adenine2030-N6)-methyltransferase
LFSYRHGFHAGNHADVLKHSVFLAVLDYFQQKDAGVWVIDTHAGAGLYDLRGEWANKKAEYLEGIARLWQGQGLPPMIARYVKAIEELNTSGELALYPGSPWLALMSLRGQDRLKLFELMNAEFSVLQKNLSQQGHLPPRVLQSQQTDGFAALKALLPPTSRRAITLIDPPYEDKQDYRHVLQAVKEAIKRFPTGTYLVWYPRVNRLEAQQLPRRLSQVPVPWLDVEMTVSKPSSDAHGLFGSGMFVINPPFTLEESLRKTMPWLTKKLAADNTARWELKTSAGLSKGVSMGTVRGANTGATRASSQGSPENAVTRPARGLTRGTARGAVRGAAKSPNKASSQ